VVDARKPLHVLQNEWMPCRRCSLGIRRHEVNGAFVFGEGALGGMMLIGEGPGINEEQDGRPFIGKSGQLLRHILETLGMNDYYLANTVACRSCAPAVDSLGRILMGRNNQPRMNDEPPLPVQVEACKPRLMEQIYIVDPLLIVALGAGAATALAGKPVTITKQHGMFQEIEVPGVWQMPVLTDKKKVWVRKVKGEIIAPTEQHRVRYLMMTTVHPAYALRFVKDKRQKNIFVEFVLDLKKAALTYNRIVQEVLGSVPPAADVSVEEVEEYANGLQEKRDTY
jgi:uracil-DNA glycosylase